METLNRLLQRIIEVSQNMLHIAIAGNQGRRFLRFLIENKFQGPATLSYVYENLEINF